MICALIARERFKLEAELLAGPSSYHASYMHEYMWYVEVPGTHRYMTAYAAFVTYVWRTWEHIYA